MCAFYKFWNSNNVNMGMSMSKLAPILLSLLLGCSSLASANGDRKLAPAIEAAYALADKVFVGTAMYLPSDSSQMVFQVIETFKYKSVENIIMSCLKMKGGCEGGPFKAGAQYLVYATKNGTTNTYNVYQDTSLTKARSLADFDIALLRSIPHPFYEFNDSGWWFDG